jgi:hypothetical protein
MAGTAMMAAALIAELMSSGDVESMVVADAGPPNPVDAMRLSMMGEGAGESVDPDPYVPTGGAN